MDSRSQGHIGDAGRSVETGIAGRAPDHGRPDLGRGAQQSFALVSSRAYPAAFVGGVFGRIMGESPLAEVFMANRAPLLRYLRARGAGDDAEDYLQELWLKARAVDGTAVGDGLAYLYRMAHNLMLDNRRASARRRHREEGYHHAARGGEGEVDDAPAAERVLLARERLRTIDRTLAGLGQRTDLIFRRYRVEGVAQRDIATELGITLSAVEKHLQKAYRAVAEAQRALDRGDEAYSRREGVTDDLR